MPVVGIDSHGTAIQTEVFNATGAPNRGLVAVVHGSDGMNEPWAAEIRGYATNLATKGFTVLIPHYFDKTGTTPGLAVFDQLSSNLDSWQEAVADTVMYGKTVLGISASCVGLLGFSLGGHICLRLRGNAKVLVEFFAPSLPEVGGLGPGWPPVPHVQIHHGTADLLVPYSNAESIAAALKLEGTAVELFAYEGAGHGFIGVDPNNATARRSSEDRTLSFFEGHLT